MPRLLLFAPCDNVLVSGDQSSVSLIIVINQIMLPQLDHSSLPENPAIPMRWYFFSQWETKEEEVGVEYNQQVTLHAPDGVIVMTSIINFVPESGKPMHRTVGQNIAFPVIPAGIYRLKLSIKASDSQDWQEAADYPITISYPEIERVAASSEVTQ